MVPFNNALIMHLTPAKYTVNGKRNRQAAEGHSANCHSTVQHYPQCAGCIVLVSAFLSHPLK